MMKLVLVLVLVQLCYSSSFQKYLNDEMIESLTGLHNLTKEGKVNFTSPHTVRGPGRKMRINAPYCVEVFKKELEDLLNSVTVDEEGEKHLQKLRDNLPLLTSHEENVSKCKMVNPTTLNGSFLLYIEFLQNLNNRA